jgi:hypothetical protein
MESSFIINCIRINVVGIVSYIIPNYISYFKIIIIAIIIITIIIGK